MPSKSFRLLGRSVLTMAIAPEPPLATWFKELDDLIKGSPGFFAGRPIILDGSGLDLDQESLRGFVSDLGDRGVRIMGIEGISPECLAPDLPPLVSGAKESRSPDPTSRSSKGRGKEPKAAASEPEMLVIDRPVRSGQSVTFRHDVTIIGSVGSGAEIVAGGSIHVYGALRGRAIAGTIGNAAARVFCSRLEAELIAISGLYKTAEDMPQELHGRAVQARLDGDAIKIAELN